MKLTDSIFKLSCPYDNPYQGPDTKLLFVCSAGLLRSATAANLYAKKGYNTRSCGTHTYALIPLSANLIAWADKIVFVNKENFDYAVTFGVYKEAITKKQVVLDIPDEYSYNHPELVKLLEEQLDPSLRNS
jgi:predicted protein tyrosine phosphatase